MRSPVVEIHRETTPARLCATASPGGRSGSGGGGPAAPIHAGRNSGTANRGLALTRKGALNVYSGTVTTDESGMATVSLPQYFHDLNEDVRYQLTVIGQFAQAIVAEEVRG